MIMSPLLQSVLMPMMTRAHDRSEEEFFALLRRSIEGVLVVAIPVTMVLSVGADVWVPLLFHHGFEHSVLVLRVLAPAFVMTYLAVLLANSLIILGKSWTVTIVSIASLAVQPILMWFLVPWLYARQGEGGAAFADAIVMAFLELFSVVGFYINIGRRALDARAVMAVVKSIAAFVIVAILDSFIRRLGPARLLVDCIAYTVIAVGTRAVNIREVITTAKDVIRRRRGG
jgi:O-antigen/teichoic acid export membrane protein